MVRGFYSQLWRVPRQGQTVRNAAAERVSGHGVECKILFIFLSIFQPRPPPPIPRVPPAPPVLALSPPRKGNIPSIPGKSWGPHRRRGRRHILRLPPLLRLRQRNDQGRNRTGASLPGQIRCERVLNRCTQRQQVVRQVQIDGRIDKPSQQKKI